MDKYHIALVPKANDDILNIGDYIAFTLLEPDISKKNYQWLTSSHFQFRVFSL